MSSSSYIILSVLLASLNIAAAQSPTVPGTSVDEPRATPAPALTGVLGLDPSVPEEDTSGDLPQIPALLGGPKMSLALGSEAERSNFLRAGLNVGATYDDNALITTNDQVGNTTFSVFPNISLEQVRSRVRWTFSYAGGLTVNQRLSSRNQGSHDLNFESQFRLSPHVNLRVAQDFSLTSGFFDSGNASGVGVGNGGPNPSLITPLSKQRSSSTVAELNYHFALKDVVGASGSFHDLHFSEVSQGALSDSRTAEGSAFWLHGFGRDWAGLSYRFQRITFDPDGETRVHSIMVVNTVKLPNRFTISGFVGPEYSDNQGVLPGSGETATAVHFSDWSFAGGVDVGWQKEHTSVAAGYSRQISNGGGVLGVVRLQSVHGNVRQQLFPGWAIAVGASYGNNQSITVASPESATSVNAGSVTASLERNLGKSLAVRLGYLHDFQDQIGVADPTRAGTANRNQFSVTLGYQWSRPLGR